MSFKTRFKSVKTSVTDVLWKHN